MKLKNAYDKVHSLFADKPDLNISITCVKKQHLSINLSKTFGPDELLSRLLKSVT